MGGTAWPRLAETTRGRLAGIAAPMGPSPGKSSNCSLTSKEPNVNNVDLYSYLVHELHQFGVLLREWRGRASPGGVGCTGQNGSRRTPGLRREELAELSLVSADYIKRLEQGRARPSLQVLRAVCRCAGPVPGRVRAFVHPHRPCGGAAGAGRPAYPSGHAAAARSSRRCGRGCVRRDMDTVVLQHTW